MMGPHADSGFYFFVLLVSLHYVSIASAHSGSSFEDVEEDFNFKIAFPDHIHFKLPSGLSCDSGNGKEPSATTGTIPIKLFFPSHLLGIPGLSNRRFQLRTAYAKTEDLQNLRYITREFDLQRAVVADGNEEAEALGAELNISVALTLSCGDYAAIIIVFDLASGTMLAQSDEIQIVVEASAHKYDFCYLVQAPSLFDTGHLTQANSSFAMVLQWKTEQPQPNSVFLPNSTWNQGRNTLFAAARQHNCRYYIFVDEDAELVHREWDSDGDGLTKPEQLGDTWREFERLLLTWQPQVAVPHAPWHRTNNKHKSVAETIALYDHMILAVSSSAVDCMLPYEVRWDQDALDYSVIPSYIVGHMLFPDRVVQFKSLSTINKDSRNWPRDILSFMRPLMWTIGAFRPRAQLFSLLSTWFYNHPKMSDFRPFINKTLEEPPATSFAGGSIEEVHKCRVRLSEVNLCHPLWLKRNVSLVNPRNGTAVRCFGDFDTAAAANEVILGLAVMLYSGMQAVCKGHCSDVMGQAMAAMSSTPHSAWSAGDQG